MKTDDMKYEPEETIYTPNGKEHFFIEQNDMIVTLEGNLYEKKDVLSESEIKEAYAKFRFD